MFSGEKAKRLRLMEQNMMITIRKECSMAMDFIPGQMEISLKVIGIKIR
jgi:hypothetical protein